MTRGVAYAANDLVTGEDFLKDTVVKMGWVWANDCEWMKRRNSGETRGVSPVKNDGSVQLKSIYFEKMHFFRAPTAPTFFKIPTNLSLFDQYEILNFLKCTQSIL